jgi:hypothetical protein
MPVRGLAEAHRIFENCVEHTREVAGRRVDDLQDLGSRGLLVESLITLDRPLSQLSLGFVPFGSCFGKLTFEIGDPLIEIG